MNARRFGKTRCSAMTMAMKTTADLEDSKPSGSKRVGINWATALKFISKLQDRNHGDAWNYGRDRSFCEWMRYPERKTIDGEDCRNSGGQLS